MQGFNNGGQVPAYGNEHTHASLLQVVQNKVSLLEEDMECAHMGLDALQVPRNSPNGTSYSLIGRITYLQKTHLRQLSEIETAVRNGINPYENE